MFFNKNKFINKVYFFNRLKFFWLDKYTLKLFNDTVEEGFKSLKNFNIRHIFFSSSLIFYNIFGLFFRNNNLKKKYKLNIIKSSFSFFDLFSLLNKFFFLKNIIMILF